MPKIVKTIKFDEPLSREHYTVGATFLWCIDRRFKRGIVELKKALNIEKVDRITVAGGAKDLADPENIGDRKYVLKQIMKSIKLHKPPHIVIMAHAGCGAYGNTPKEKVLEHLVYAKDLLLGFEPVSANKITVDAAYVDFDGIHLIEKV